MPYSGAHFATFPPQLIKPCILAGCPAGGVVLDPFMGSGTTLAVATALGRDGLGIELNPDYLPLAETRLDAVRLPLFEGGISWDAFVAAESMQRAESTQMQEARCDPHIDG